MKSVFILLVAVGVAVADVSELVNSYLPPPIEQKVIIPEVPTTEAPIVEPEVTTPLTATTVVEIEQVPLEEMHYEEQPREVTQMTEEPAVPSIYQQPPALPDETPSVEVPTEAPVEETTTPAAEVTTSQPATIIVEEEIVIIAEEPTTEEPESSVLVEAGSAIDAALGSIDNEVPVVKEAPEVEPEPAHELAEDGYRYKSANRFRYRF